MWKHVDHLWIICPVMKAARRSARERPQHIEACSLLGPFRATPGGPSQPHSRHRQQVPKRLTAQAAQLCAASRIADSLHKSHRRSWPDLQKPGNMSVPACRGSRTQRTLNAQSWALEEKTLWSSGLQGMVSGWAFSIHVFNLSALNFCDCKVGCLNFACISFPDLMQNQRCKRSASYQT